jgi:NADPH-dependent curcumin reductase CurA
MLGLLKIGELRDGADDVDKTVFVSAAPGAVSPVVCRIAKINEYHILGGADSQEKVKWGT